MCVERSGAGWIRARYSVPSSRLAPSRSPPLEIYGSLSSPRHMNTDWAVHFHGATRAWRGKPRGLAFLFSTLACFFVFSDPAQRLVNITQLSEGDRRITSRLICGHQKEPLFISVQGASLRKRFTFYISFFLHFWQCSREKRSYFQNQTDSDPFFLSFFTA